MLTACPHTFLRCRGAAIGTSLKAGKNIFKLNHTGICKHQSLGHFAVQGAGTDNFMIALGKEIQELTANITDS